MSTIIHLADIRQGKRYRISTIDSQQNEYSEKLHKMGFVQGTPIELAPVKTFDPVVFKIRGSRISLRREEARQVLVEEVCDA